MNASAVTRVLVLSLLCVSTAAIAGKARSGPSSPGINNSNSASAQQDASAPKGASSASQSGQ